MALFKDLFSTSRTPKANREVRGTRTVQDDEANGEQGSETKPVPMNLEERMAFRRELLYETIRASLNSCFIAPNTYRFKVMRTDKRGHCFIVMLDMSPTFMDSAAGKPASLRETAAVLVKHADTKYGLQVGGVYWRADETLDVSVANWARPGTPTPKPHVPSTASERQSNIEKFEAVTAEEMAEFEAAWQKDSAIRVGDRTYSSDMAPLMDESRK
jgi:hypothetical protein